MIDKSKHLIIELLDKFSDFCSDEEKVHLLFFTFPTIICLAILSIIEPFFLYILAGSIMATGVIICCFAFIKSLFKEEKQEDTE